MRIAFALLLLVCCLATTSATLKLLKSKIKPLNRYKPVKYLQQPVFVPEPLPVAYARPVSTYSAHVSTYSVSSPTVAEYAVPVQTYAVPQVVEYAAPVAVYSQPIWRYAEQQPDYFEPFATHLIEEHYSHYEDRKR